MLNPQILIKQFSDKSGTVLFNPQTGEAIGLRLSYCKLMSLIDRLDSSNVIDIHDIEILCNSTTSLSNE